MIALKANNELDAQTEALNLSDENPDQYVIVVANFGLYASLSRRLNVHAPSDSPFAWYARNGKLRPFTEGQKGADEKATPVLS